MCKTKLATHIVLYCPLCCIEAKWSSSLTSPRLPTASTEERLLFAARGRETMALQEKQRTAVKTAGIVNACLDNLRRKGLLKSEVAVWAPHNDKFMIANPRFIALVITIKNNFQIMRCVGAPEKRRRRQREGSSHGIMRGGNPAPCV